RARGSEKNGGTALVFGFSHPAETVLPAAVCRKDDLIGSGGRDRTADLGVMNHHPGKNVSFCFFESCSHQGFPTILHPFPFATFSCTGSAVYSGHKLARRIWGEPLG